MSEPQTPGGSQFPGQPLAPFNPPSQAYPQEPQQPSPPQQQPPQYQQAPQHQQAPQYQQAPPQQYQQPQQSWGAPPPSGPPPNPFADAMIKASRNDNRKWLYIGGGVAVALLAVIVLLLTGVIPAFGGDDKSDSGGSGGSSSNGGGTDNSASAAAAPNNAKPYPLSDVDKLLASDDELRTVVGAVPAGVINVLKTLYTGEYVDPDCGPFTSTGRQSAFRGSGWSSAAIKSLTEPNPNSDNRGWQVVVAFPTADRANAYYQSTTSKLRGCSGKSIDDQIVGTDSAFNWTIGPVDETDGITNWTNTQEGGDGWTCQFALAARNNLVLSSEVCGQSINAGTAASLVKKAAAKMPQ